jgi:type I restriction enzyme S subunit
MTWRDCRLGDVLTLKRGHDLPAQSRVDGEVPVVSSSGITGYHSEAKAQAPGVVTGRYGTIGEVFFLEEDYWPLNTSLYVIDFKGSDPKFSAYFLKNVLKGYQSDKAAVPGVDRNVLHEIRVRAPDVDMQKGIVSILSAYDDLIENNRRRIALLEETARLLYREWFVHLRFPGYEHTRIVDGVPEGWIRANFADFIDFLEGPGLRNHQYRDEGIPFLNIRTIRDDDVDFSKVQYLDENEVATKYQHFLLKENDHVVSSSGTLGRVVTIRAGHLPLVLNTSLIRMRPKSYVGRWFIKSYLKHGDYLAMVTSMATGAAQLNYGPMHLKQLTITVATPIIAVLFEEQVEPMYEQIKVLIDVNQKLRAARDLLLPRLMTGEIAV